MPVHRCVFSVPFFSDGRLLRNSGAAPLPVASFPHRSPGRVFRRFLLLPSVSPICCSRVLPGSGVFLSSCLVAFPGFRGFRKWPIRPDGCVPPVAFSRRLLPVFSSSVVSSFRSPLRRFVVTVSSDFVASFCYSGFFFSVLQQICFSSLRRLLVCGLPVACSRFLPLRRFLAPAAPGVFRFRFSLVPRRLFFLPIVIGPSLSPLVSFRFRFPSRSVPVSASSFCLSSSAAPVSSCLFPPVGVALLVVPVCCSALFSRLRYPVSLFSFRPGSSCWLRLPDSAYPLFATSRLRRNVAPSRLFCSVNPLLSFPNRFLALLGRLSLP